MIALAATAPLSTYEMLNGTAGIPVDPSGDGGPGPIAAVLLVLVVLYGLRAMARAAKNRDRQRDAQLAAAEAQGSPLIAITQLPAELKGPLDAFRKRGVEYLTPAQLAQIYDDCALVAEHRARLYEHQAELMKAQTAYHLAVAAAKFVAGLNTEERALLQTRIEARARLDFDQLQQRNAQLESEAAQYRNLLSGPRQD